MNLTLFFRLISVSLVMGSRNFTTQNKEAKDFYKNTYFFCPRVYAKDGFNISLQINAGNYCESENGYRKIGYTWNLVEWGFPSENDDLLKESADDYENITNTVGSISIEVLEKLFEKRGGIDWEKTISVEACSKLIPL